MPTTLEKIRGAFTRERSKTSVPDRSAPVPRRDDSDEVLDGFETAESATATVERQFKDGRTRMYGLLKRWLTSLMMYRGTHYLLLGSEDEQQFFYENGGEGYENDPEEDGYVGKVRFKANIIQSHVDSWVARMIANSPRVETYPRTQDQEDRDAARLYNGLVDWKRSEQGWEETYQEAITMTAIMGNAFLKARFDPQAGEFVREQSPLKEGDFDLLGDPEIQQRYGAQDLDRLRPQPASFEDLEPEGNVVSEAVPPYEVTYVDEQVRSMRQAKRVIHSRVVSLQQIKEEFAGHPDLHRVTPGLNDEGQTIWFSEKVGAMGDDNATLSTGSSAASDAKAEIDADELVLRHEYWAKPTKLRPRGILCIVAGGVMLYPRKIKDLANPYHHGEIPLSHLKHTDDKINLWATCHLEQGTEVQEEFNRSISQAIESRNLTANPVVLEEEGALVNGDELLNVPGERWIRKRNRTVEYLQPPVMPAYTTNLMHELRHDLEIIFSDHQPDQGISKAGDSGFKVRSLQMATEARHKPFAKNVAAQIQRHWVQMLCLMAQYTDKEKVGYITGQMAEQTFFSFSRQSMMGVSRNGDREAFKSPDDDARAQVLALKHRLNLRVEVVPGKSQQTVREDVQLLVQTGSFRPEIPAHRRMILDMMDYAFESPALLEDEREQSAQASIENNVFIEQQQIPPPGHYENHDVHARAHRRFTLTQDFKDLDPRLRVPFENHIELHEMGAIKEQVRQAYLQQKVIAEMTQQFGPLLAPPAEAGQGQPGQGASAGPQRSPAGPAPQPGAR